MGIKIKSNTPLEILKEFTIKWQLKYRDSEPEKLEYIWNSIKDVPVKKMKYLINLLS